jgi:hypothetical protein
MEYPEQEAEKIVDAFLAYEGPDDLSLLQREVVAAVKFAYEMGCFGKALAPHTAPRRLPRYLR